MQTPAAAGTDTISTTGSWSVSDPIGSVWPHATEMVAVNARGGTIAVAALKNTFVQLVEIGVPNGGSTVPKARSPSCGEEMVAE